MTTNEKWARAFTIFAEYGDTMVSAEHDTLYAGPDPEDVSDEHIAELDGLGWSIDEDCFRKFT